MPNTPLLLVAPPMSHPALLSTHFRRMHAVLRRMGYQVHVFHAGLDYLSYSMRADVREELLTRVRRHVQAGRFAAAQSTLAMTAASFAQGAPDGQEVEETDVAGVLQTAAFFDPVAVSNVLQAIDRSLMRVSLAYHPAVVDRRSFSHPDLSDLSMLAQWAADEGRNPFLAYARVCRPPIPAAQCRHIVLVLDAPGQFAGAATLARTWQTHHPGIFIGFLAADENLQGMADRMSAAILEGRAHGPAANLIRSVRRSMAANDTPAEDIPDAGALLLPAHAAETRFPAAIAALHADGLQAVLAGAVAAPGTVLVWHDPEGEISDLSAQLYQAAKKGLWNHVIVPDRPEQPLIGQLIRFAAANPNIVHSWCRRRAPVSPYSDPRDIYPVGNPPYGASRSLQGTPLWQRLQDPVYLGAYAVRNGAKTLSRMFLMPGGGFHLAGSRLAYHYEPPPRLPPGYLDEIVRMVAAGGSVQTQWVRHNLERAFLIGYVEENGILIGNSSLKHPRGEYIEAVSRQTGIDLSGYLERGYTSVRPEYRSLGVGAKLLEGLTERAEGYRIYSVIAEDNVATQKMALRNRTRKVAAFHSPRSGKTIGIWIPEWMLPEGIVLPPQPEPD